MQAILINALYTQRESVHYYSLFSLKMEEHQCHTFNEKPPTSQKQRRLIKKRGLIHHLVDRRQLEICEILRAFHSNSRIGLEAR